MVILKNKADPGRAEAPWSRLILTGSGKVKLWELGTDHGLNKTRLLKAIETAKPWSVPYFLVDFRLGKLI